MTGAPEPAKTNERRQCAKCPWKVSTDPHTIPNGYTEEAHSALESTIAEGFGSLRSAPKMMACHESPVGAEEPCVGWLVHQLGPGNNFGLRMQALGGRFGDLVVDGEQHETFEETLP
mgnify:FL=1